MRHVSIIWLPPFCSTWAIAHAYMLMNLEPVLGTPTKSAYQFQDNLLNDGSTPSRSHSTDLQFSRIKSYTPTTRNFQTGDIKTPVLHSNLTFLSPPIFLISIIHRNKTDPRQLYCHLPAYHTQLRQCPIMHRNRSWCIYSIFSMFSEFLRLVQFTSSFRWHSILQTQLRPCSSTSVSDLDRRVGSEGGVFVALIGLGLGVWTISSRVKIMQLLCRFRLGFLSNMAPWAHIPPTRHDKTLAP
ncbi:hypothetical protein BJ165DRAFT_235960 [Panaeolus papilionaceus]|nr:hypothetical protein BJ165DRAFT_235960 [Panaeolus papilionaceus]